MKYAMKKRMAKGGEMGAKCYAHGTMDCPVCKADGGEVDGYDEPDYGVDKDKAKKAAGSMREAFGFAEGGDVVDRIMKKRSHEPIVDFEDNDFDASDEEKVPDDADYTAENSGDELGNKELDENDADLIRRIMKSRAKKDKMPRPA